MFGIERAQPAILHRNRRCRPVEAVAIDAHVFGEFAFQFALQGVERFAGPLPARIGAAIRGLQRNTSAFTSRKFGSDAERVTPGACQAIEKLREIGGKLVADRVACMRQRRRSEEHTSELQSRGLISYAVFCLKKKKL